MKWLIVAILFVGDTPVNSKIFPLDPGSYKTLADCEKELADFKAEAKENKADVWAACIEVKRDGKSNPLPSVPGTKRDS